MNDREFIDFYEVMEVSSSATSETIERIFRYFGQRYHPDNSETGDSLKFRRLLAAYTTLRDPQKRAAYDVRYKEFQVEKSEIAKGAKATATDCDDRHRLLSLFYSQRRRDMRQPGIGSSSLEQVMDCPAEVLEFHLWYFREKGWIKREECGLYAITADGIDRIEASEQRITSPDRTLTMQSARQPGVASIDGRRTAAVAGTPHLARAVGGN